MSKFCLFCGAVNSDEQVLCTKCGKELIVSKTPPQYSASQLGAQYTSPQYSSTAPNVSSTAASQRNTQSLPMRWFKFITWVQLILSGVLCVGNGLMSINGMQYETEMTTATMVYAVFPELKTIDCVYGFISICLGICAFVVRNQLVKYKKNAPKMYLIWLGVYIAASLVYIMASVSIIDGGMESTNVVTTGVAVGMLIYSISYFKQRENLFIN